MTLCVITCFVLFLFAASGGPAAHAQAGINITYPSGATGVCNVKNSPYNATGNGATDDTAAIQKALNDSNCNFVYLPNGTYRLTGALQWPYYTVHYGSIWLIGQTQTGTVLQLDNSKFTSGSTAIMNLCGDSTHGGCYSASNYFNVGIRNLSLNTGSGNAGAIGINFYANNIGAVRDVTITSNDKQGVYGLLLNSPPYQANGPLLVKNLTVNGFQTGVQATIGQVDSATLEHITVKNQTTTGMYVNGTVSMRDLESTNTVPALTQAGGFLTLVDGTLTGGTANAAINVTAGDVLVRNITSSGYAHALANGSNTQNSPIAEWTNDTVYAPWGGSGKTLNLPISETPAATWDAATTWTCVSASSDATGATDYTNIQAALNSGASTVCLHGGYYYLNNTLSVGGSVYHVLVAGTAGIQGVGNLNNSTTPFFQLAASGPSTVVFEGIGGCSGCYYTLESNPTSRTMVVMEGGGSVSATGTGNTFVEDISGSIAVSGGNLWARQLNPENCPSGICASNTGSGNLWILGQKQEGSQQTIKAYPASMDTGSTELLGGLMYDCCGTGTNEFSVRNSQFSARIFEASSGGTWWTNFVKDIEYGLPSNGTTPCTGYNDTKTCYVTDGGSTGGVLGLYTNGGNVPPAPVALAATSITSSGFTANWQASTGAIGYKLDVSTSSSFSSFVGSYNGYTVFGTSYAVTGLSANTKYYYRLRAYDAPGTSGNSNTITVTTTN
jgi:hypothetical protein